MKIETYYKILEYLNSTIKGRELSRKQTPLSQAVQLPSSLIR